MMVVDVFAFVAFTRWYYPVFASLVDEFSRCFQSDGVKAWKRRTANWKRREREDYKACGSSAFLYTKEMTVVSYVAKTSRTKKKMVLLL